MTESPSHSPWGMSAAARYMKCPGSVAANFHHPSEDSEYAAEGTRAHELAAKTLQNPAWSVAQALDQFPPAFQLEVDSIEAVRDYVRYVRQLLKREPDAKLHVETQFMLATPELPQIDGKVFGTCDALIYFPHSQTLHVVDYKNGVGVSVEIEQNPQLLGYAAGALFALSLPVVDVVMTIVQPRVSTGDKIKTVTVPVTSVFEFRGDLVRSIRKSLESPDLRVPGEHCRFCGFAGSCPELADHTAGSVLTLQKLLPAPDGMCNEKLGYLVLQAPQIKSFLKAAERELWQRLISGRGEGSGAKLVAGARRRDWLDTTTQDSIAEFLSLADIPPELRQKVQRWSPAEAESLIKAHVGDEEAASEISRAMILRLAEWKQGGSVVAPLADKRKAVNPASEHTSGLGALLPPSNGE